MSQTSEILGEQKTAPSARPPRRARTGIIVVLILSLLASAGARYLADTKREMEIPNRGEVGSGTSLSNMNSFALGLLLGGLRGPLVMFLWTESETNKTAKHLEDVDTQIEWIRLLQPEFDTVHIFQIWNKAYNISVQMASLGNKYSVILDALDYAKSVDRQKPDDINIIAAMAQIYLDKLGGSNEKEYYRRRVREESKPHRVASKLRRQDPGWRRIQMDPLLDDQLNILPNLIQPAPGRARPASLAADQEWNDGADLQYLPRYQPYLDGVSPLALAYNYYKRAEVLMNVGRQHHAQLSDVVIDSRPALSLKIWSEEEWEQGRHRELQALGQPIPDDRDVMETASENLVIGQPFIDRSAAELALFDYKHAIQIANDSGPEYLRHLAHDPSREQQYKSQMDDVRGEVALLAGDRDYLAAALAEPAARAPLLASAAKEYRTAVWLYELVILRYYTDQDHLKALLPPGYGELTIAGHRGIDDLTPQQTYRIFADPRNSTPDQHDVDRAPYMRYLQRASVRLSHLR